MARALFYQGHLPQNFWNFSVQHAVHIINKLPTPLLKGKCPYELLYNKPPNLIHLRVFGCLSYVSTLEYHRTKFQPRAKKDMFLGYKEGTKGYIIYDLYSHQFLVPRNVIFYENIFPFQPNNSGEEGTTTNIPQVILANADDLAELTPHVPEPDTNMSTATTSFPGQDDVLVTVPETEYHPPVRQSSRIRKRPSYPEDYHCSLTVVSSSTSSSGSVSYPLSSVISYDNCSRSYKHFCFSISSLGEPTSYLQASKLDCWQKAM